MFLTEVNLNTQRAASERCVIKTYSYLLDPQPTFHFILKFFAVPSYLLFCHIFLQQFSFQPPLICICKHFLPKFDTILLQWVHSCTYLYLQPFSSKILLKFLAVGSFLWERLKKTVTWRSLTTQGYFWQNSLWSNFHWNLDKVPPSCSLGNVINPIWGGGLET